MELPDTIKAVGEQLGNGGNVTPPPEWFEAYDVFATELPKLFLRPWLAVDHASRLAENGDYFRVDVGPRSAIVVREAADKIYAMRNACLHAGYRVCEAEGGRADHFFCIYHGWDYAIDGTLTDPILRPNEKDRSRFRLPRFAMHIDRGLVLIDMSTSGPTPPEVAAPDLAAVPEALANAVVASRQRINVTWNWKYLRQFLWSAQELAFPDGDCDEIVEFGPMSYMALRGDEAALVRMIPRYPGHSDFEIVRMAPHGKPAAEGNERLTEAVRQYGEKVAAAPLATLERPFYDWYWSAVSAEA
jgi:nitrite reductase/ring-hydroxylating ferredoxin subunit